MKIETTVKGVEMIGDEMHLKLQGWPTTAPDGTMAQDYSLPIPASAKAKRAFYIGRKVNVTVEPM
jgi:hypothetical protein